VVRPLLKRLYVLVFIGHGTRRMHRGGVSVNPTGELRPVQRAGGPARPLHPSREALTWRYEPVTLRWVLMYLIGETARHADRIGILREMAGGATGR